VARTVTHPPRDPRATLAAFLSFLFPGVGQAYNGDRRLAAMLAAPIALLVLLGILAVAFARNSLFIRLLDVRFLIGLIVLDGVVLAWRLVAVLQAHAHRERPSWRNWTTYVTAGIVVLTLAMHALPGWYGILAINTLQSIARGGTADPSIHDAFGGVGVDVPIPSEIPNASQQRVNILLAGIDWRPGRGEHLTDTMLVVSLDPQSGESAMISVPRDLYGARLPDGRIYNAKLNSLLIIATLNPAEYPLGGVGTLKATIGRLLGIKIHYFASINLIGFKDAVDAIDGVDVTVERAISDPTYRDENGVAAGLFLQPGRYHMDGHLALAYARSRKGLGDNDFTRAARQQQLLSAIRAKLTAGNLITALPGLLEAVQNTIATDVPADQLSSLARAVQDADLDHVERAVIQPPLVQPATGPGGSYILVPDFGAIRALGRRLMNADVATPTP
jgi:LCP family protein required for cell wall assembly